MHGRAKSTAQILSAVWTIHAYPIIGDLPIAAVDEALVLHVLRAHLEGENSHRTKSAMQGDERAGFDRASNSAAVREEQFREGPITSFDSNECTQSAQYYRCPVPSQLDMTARPI
jgi:hypothetical protein